MVVLVVGSVVVDHVVLIRIVIGIVVGGAVVVVIGGIVSVLVFASRNFRAVEVVPTDSARFDAQQQTDTRAVARCDRPGDGIGQLYHTGSEPSVRIVRT